MDRQIVYIGEMLQDTDILDQNINEYVALAKLAAAILGTNTVINNFNCIPTSPASLNVIVTPGELYAVEAIDTNPYGSLATNAIQILKQGILLVNSANLSCPAPVTVGNSINYLIEITFTEVDTGTAVLPYYNSANPSQTWQGPNNTGMSSNTVRQDTVTITAKAGASATTGTQVTPSPDAGYVGAFVVTVAHGQTTITSSSISAYATAPFITSAVNNYAADTSVSANTLTASISAPLNFYTLGLELNIKVANTNTGASTINVNTLGAINIVYPSGSSLNAGELVAGEVTNLIYDGTHFQLRNANPSSSTGSYSYAVDTGSTNTVAAALNPVPSAYVAGMRCYIKIANTNTGASTINLNSLGAKNITYPSTAALTGGELVANAICELVYDGTRFQLLSPSIVPAAILNSSFVYAADSGSTNVLAITLSPAPVAYVTGMRVIVKVANTNTSTATINLNSLGAKNITYPTTAALVGGELVAGQMAELIYDGTEFQVVSTALIPAVPLAILNSSYVYAVDSSVSANTVTLILSPAATSYVSGMRVMAKIANTNTGASTINVNALAAKNITYPNGTALVGGELISNQIVELIYDGSEFQLLASITNPAFIQKSTYIYAADSGSANSYAVTLTPAPASYVTGLLLRTKIANTNTGASTINVNSLGSKNIKNMWGNTLVANELAAGQMAELMYDGTNFQLLNSSAYLKTITGTQTFTSTGSNTYTPTVGTQYVQVEILGGGASGGGAAGGTGTSAAGSGGGGGGYSKGIYPIATILGGGSNAQVNIGAGGVVGTAGNNPGNAGGTSSLKANGGSGSTIIQATGGSAGNGCAASSGSQVINGVVGGVGSSGSINSNGGEGGSGFTITTVIAVAGFGGTSFYGGSVSNAAAIPGGNTTGNSGVTYGSGGSGGASVNTGSVTGGAGANGICVITEFGAQ